MVSLSTLRGAQAEMDAAVVLRQIAGAGDAFRVLLLAACRYFDACADAIAIALLARSA